MAIFVGAVRSTSLIILPFEPTFGIIYSTLRRCFNAGYANFSASLCYCLFGGLRETLINSRAAVTDVTESRHCKVLSPGIRN